MRGNSQVRFLGGWVGAIPPGYPTYVRVTRLAELSILKPVIIPISIRGITKCSKADSNRLPKLSYYATWILGVGETCR